MSVTIAAYLRVSTGQQSIDQQQDAIAAAGIAPDRVFTDTASGRAGSNRPGWTECMGYLREGDHLVVVAVDRLGRSVREVATALHELTSRGVHVRSLREGVDTSTPTGRAVTSIMATIADIADRIALFSRPQAAWARARGLPRAAWGGAIAHAGMGVMILGLAGRGLATDTLKLLKPGEATPLAGLEYRLAGVTDAAGPNFSARRATVEVRDGSRLVTTLE